MTGGTLLVSRAVNLHGHHKKRLEELGFANVSVTNTEKDGLDMLIRDIKPRLVIISAQFYCCSTPYMMAGLLKRFPKLNIAVVSMCDYPADRAMSFIINGVRSYISYWDGVEQFYKGLEEVREGRQYISAEVRKLMDMKDSWPNPSRELTPRLLEIAKLLANGFKGDEIADVLHISVRTVNTQKSNIYSAWNVRNENELIRVALALGEIEKDELNFYGRDYALSPKPLNNKMSSRTYEERRRIAGTMRRNLLHDSKVGGYCLSEPFPKHSTACLPFYRQLTSFVN